MFLIDSREKYFLSFTLLLQETTETEQLCCAFKCHGTIRLLDLQVLLINSLRPGYVVKCVTNITYL